ncbi:MAG: hypothetical protein M1829_000746 [Trizodia sp. TS-e1964]|nr:MAG: hypothetical protein M1829_000746 [Trizodia sp. TS-e1964]
MPSPHPHPHSQFQNFTFEPPQQPWIETVMNGSRGDTPPLSPRQVNPHSQQQGAPPDAFIKAEYYEDERHRVASDPFALYDAPPPPPRQQPKPGPRERSQFLSPYKTPPPRRHYAPSSRTVSIARNDLNHDDAIHHAFYTPPGSQSEGSTQRPSELHQQKQLFEALERICTKAARGFLRNQRRVRGVYDDDLRNTTKAASQHKTAPAHSSRSRGFSCSHHRALSPHHRCSGPSPRNYSRAPYPLPSRFAEEQRILTPMFRPRNLTRRKLATKVQEKPPLPPYLEDAEAELSAKELYAVFVAARDLCSFSLAEDGKADVDELWDAWERRRGGSDGGV